jgi:cytochrome c peroxidase
MKFAIRSLLQALAGTAVALSCASSHAAGEMAREKILRTRILESGFMPADTLYRNAEENLASAGKVFFESKHLSLNGDIACQTCHLAKFGSADGLPIAAAIYGKGEGPQRALSGALFLPRNTLALWGRGAVGFDTFFWDGRVQVVNGKVVSAFASKAPSDDPLIVAAHLPSVEVRAMHDEDEIVKSRKRESVSTAQDVFDAIARHLQRKEPKAIAELASVLGKEPKSVEFLDVARSIAAFIRSEFRIRSTRLERFALGSEQFTKAELEGGLLFYGRGNCAACHSGPYFSDFKFYSVAFPQLGFGKNGFGIDYGRFNATLTAADQYRFRTPPLYNVEKTAPYGHSGSVATIKEAVVAHFDPLRLVNISKMTALERNDFYKRLTLSKEVVQRVGFLDDKDVDSVIAFLNAMSF